MATSFLGLRRRECIGPTTVPPAEGPPPWSRLRRGPRATPIRTPRGPYRDMASQHTKRFPDALMWFIPPRRPAPRGPTVHRAEPRPLVPTAPARAPRKRESDPADSHRSCCPRGRQIAGCRPAPRQRSEVGELRALALTAGSPPRHRAGSGPGRVTAVRRGRGSSENPPWSRGATHTSTFTEAPRRPPQSIPT